MRSAAVSLHGLVCAFLLISCAQSTPSPFDLILPDGAGVSIRQDIPSGTAGDVVLESPGRTAVHFTLSSPVDLKSPERALEIRYSLAGTARMDLYAESGRDEPFLSVELARGAGEIRWLLPLTAGGSLAAITFKVSEGEPEPGTGQESRLSLRALSIVQADYGFELLDGGARFSRGASFTRTEGGHTETLRVEHPYATGGSFVRMVARAGSFRVGSEGGKTAHVRLMKESEVFIPLAALKGSGAVYAEADGSGLLESIYIQEDEGGELPAVDLATVLEVPEPGAAYGLYRWSVLPRTLIFDFRDYAVQDAYLKRLAFFVEKEGFRGRLAADSEIRHMHGWNAHDYRAEDLAGFFDRAERTGFPLAAEEKELRGILEGAGILERVDGGFKPGNGAIISISRESTAYLRKLFLNHEASHAVFFQDAKYRSLAESLWRALSPQEKRFWDVFLSNRDYDPADDYLSYNELQAYIVQQPVSELEVWMRQIAYPRLARSYPDRAAAILADLEASIPGFNRRAEVLEDYLHSTYGIRAGALELIRYD